MVQLSKPHKHGYVCLANIRALHVETCTRVYALTDNINTATHRITKTVTAAKMTSGMITDGRTTASNTCGLSLKEPDMRVPRSESESLAGPLPGPRGRGGEGVAPARRGIMAPLESRAKGKGDGEGGSGAKGITGG